MIDLATLPDNLEVQRAAKRVQAVQLDIDAAQKRLHLLQSQLSTLIGELKVAVQIARPMKSRCVATKPKAKTGPNAKRPKQSAADRLAEKKARAIFHNAPKEVEVEHRVGGVLVGKRIVTRS